MNEKIIHHHKTLCDDSNCLLRTLPFFGLTGGSQKIYTNEGLWNE